MPNPYDQFDKSSTNPYEQFTQTSVAQQEEPRKPFLEGTKETVQNLMNPTAVGETAANLVTSA